MLRARKSSLRVSLVLIGAVALSACSDRTEQRDLYTSLEDCAKDWGRPAQCERAAAGAASSSPGRTGIWYGPHYSVDTDSRGNPRPSRHAVGATHVTRGGFGSSSAFHSSGS